MVEETMIRIVLAVIVGVLFGIVYAMRVLVLMERRVARIEKHIEALVRKTLREEEEILSAVKRKNSKRKSTKKTTKKSKPRKSKRKKSGK